VAIKVRKIKSVSNLIGWLKKDIGNSDEPVWFRGHSKASWQLLPCYQRLKTPPPESVLQNRFKQNANLLVPHGATGDFDWLFIMQHYGVPTRLLDWTESPLAALYFTVCEHPKSDAVLWALFPLQLNRQTTARPEEVRHLPSFDDEQLKSYSTLSVEKNPQTGMLPMAVIATRNNPRIQAQLGVFTVSHHTRTALERIGSGSHLIKYSVSAASKSKIRSELRMLAVSKFQLFPELAIVGEIIRGDLR
jgi:hypothetical protein